MIIGGVAMEATPPVVISLLAAFFDPFRLIIMNSVREFRNKFVRRLFYIPLVKFSVENM